MRWNWQLDNWPHFVWDDQKLKRAEQLFLEEAALMAGASRYLNKKEGASLMADLMSMDAVYTSEIEGEILNRHSVHSSICKALGVSQNTQRATPAEAGVAHMMVSLYQTLGEKLTESRLFDWHQCVMQGRYTLEHIGGYRTYKEAMQIISGPDYAKKVHFEAPPSPQVSDEMSAFLTWFNEKNTSSTIIQAGISHLWFESTHPFEDGNERIGRAVAEKVLAEGMIKPSIIILSQTLLKYRKTYYQALSKASLQLEITDWLLWFATIVIESQRSTLAYIDFIMHKSKLLESVRGHINARQEKVLLRMFREGPDGFVGGLSAANYMQITKATSATTTRDLGDLFKKDVLRREGKRKSTRYFLNIDVTPVKKVLVQDIS
jgi:Fic family protein